MADSNGRPTILERMLSSRPQRHRAAHTNAKRWEGLLGSAQGFMPSRDVPKRKAVKKAGRDKASYRGARRNERRVARARQLWEKHHGQ